jgi:hypothetical protein
MPLGVQASASWNTAAGHDSDVALVITVNQSNGDPLAGLQQSDFKVYETAWHNWSRDEPGSYSVLRVCRASQQWRPRCLHDRR